MRKILGLVMLLYAVSSSGVWLLHWEEGAYSHVAWNESGNGWGVRFDPPFDCGWIETVNYYVYKAPDDDWDTFELRLCEYSMGAEIPGEFRYYFGEVDNNIPGDEGWVSVDVSYSWETLDSFVIALIQPNDSPDCDSIAVDAALTDPNPNFEYFDGYWLPFVLKDGDFLIQVEYLEYASVDATSIGRIKALYE